MFMVAIHCFIEEHFHEVDFFSSLEEAYEFAAKEADDAIKNGFELVYFDQEIRTDGSISGVQHRLLKIGKCPPYESYEINIYEVRPNEAYSYIC